MTCYDSNQLAIVDARGRTVRMIWSDSWGHGFLGPNDVTRDHKGGVYVSASGVYDVKAPIQGMILHLAADESLWPVARDIHYPNGLAATPDGRRLSCPRCWLAASSASRSVRTAAWGLVGSSPPSGPGRADAWR